MEATGGPLNIEEIPATTTAATNPAAGSRFLEATKPSVLPQSQAAVSAWEGIAPKSFNLEATLDRQAQEEQEYISKNASPGVPLDVRSGAGMLTRLRTGAQRNKEAQLQVLRGIYGDDAVRLDTEGNFIARVTADGAPRDILVDERNSSWKDFLDLTSEIPALALSLATTKGVPVKDVFRQAVRGAAGYAAGGAATDAVVRIAEGQDPQFGEIFTSRGGNAIADTVLGYGAGKGISAIGTLPKLARLSSSTLADSAEKGAMAEIEAGRKAVEGRFGIAMEPTVAELTGNPMMLRLEAFLSNIPIARNRILQKWQAQIDNEKAIQNAMLGGKAPDPGAVGNELVELIGGELKRSEEIASTASSIVQSQGRRAITEPLESIPGRPISAHQFGSRTIRRGEAQLQSFKSTAKEKFDLVRSQPDASQPLFNSQSIKEKATGLRDELVKDTSGEPIKALSPSGLGNVLDSVQKLPDEMSYFDLVKLRDSIYDRVDSPEPISSKGSRLLKNLGAEITRQIESQGKAKLTPATWDAIQDANKYYRENVETFYQKGIVDILKPRTEAGAINPELVASRLLAGGKGSVTTYNTVRDFFEKSGAVKDMNRLLRDRIIEGGTDAGTGLLNVEKLAGSVSKLEPEIAKHLFGKSKEEVLQAFHHGQIAERAGVAMKAGGDMSQVEAEAFKNLLDSGELNGPAIRTLLNRSMDLRVQYGNSIRRSLKENDFGVIEANPEMFVKEFLLHPRFPNREVADVMRSVYRTGNTELIEDIRRVYLGEIFNAAAKQTKGDVGQLVGRIKGNPLRDLDPQALSLQLQNPENRTRMVEILGEQGFKDLTDFALSIGGRALRDKGGQMAGIFTGGSLFEKMLSGLEGLSEIPKYMALSYFATSPKTIQMLRSADKISPMNFDRAIRSAVLTPEFMRAVSTDSDNPEEAYQTASELKQFAEELESRPTPTP